MKAVFNVISVSNDDLLRTRPEMAAGMLRLLSVKVHHLFYGCLQSIFGVVVFCIDICINDAPHILDEWAAVWAGGQAISRTTSGRARYYKAIILCSLPCAFLALNVLAMQYTCVLFF